MSTTAIDAMSITRNSIYKGPGRLVIAASDVDFPTKIEDVLSLSTYALASGWSDVGPTNADGMTISREAEVSDGIELDQLSTNLDEGEPEKWSMNAELSLLETTLENFQIAWGGGTIAAISESEGSNVAQHSLSLDAPTSFVERRVVLIQQDPKTERLRLFAFRKCVPEVDGNEVKVSRSEASELPLKFKIRLDSSIDEGSGQFGMLFEVDADA